jgi:hypothetical protein
MARFAPQVVATKAVLKGLCASLAAPCCVTALQAVYDTLETKDVYSRFFGGCKAGAMEEGSTLGKNNRDFINVGEAAAKYKVSISHLCGL